MAALGAGRITVAVASGKGGTGKTLVSTNLAVTASRAGSPVSLVDCDAEAPNDALFLPPVEAQVSPVEVPLPVVDQKACLLCGACRNACAYGAIRILGNQVLVFSELCHNCGACSAVCVPGAIREEPQRTGELEWGPVAREITRPASVTVVTGRLDIGEVKTPTLVRAARKRAAVSYLPVTILDSPPGVACSAVAAIHGADVLVLVTEPTPFGVHDLKLAVSLGRTLDVPIGVVVNRAGPPDAEKELERFCDREGLPILARIPFDRRIAALYAEGELVIDGHEEASAWFDALWESVRKLAEDSAL